ncbi:MAG TPA: cyclodeaminase/cyclohydrolase family protein [Chloroflexota bacterium]|nr:cyclodeaminase/cyclohydrolase family protein [Chloroflexota bacterium]
MSEASFAQLTIEAFCGRLASGESTPGGGAAAGLMARLAADLVQMVCHHTIGRPRYAAVEERVTAIRDQAARLGAEATRLMDADSAAFRDVSAAYKLPKDAEGRAQRVSDACKVATEVPLAVIRAAAQLSALADEVASIGNRSLGTDARTAKVAALAAADASHGNVKANRASILDTAWADRVAGEAEQLLAGMRAAPG